MERDGLREDRLDLFWWLVCERQRVWQRRVVEGRPPPWSDDLTLQRERFTNVYRILDPGTQYAIERILEVPAPKPDRIFNVLLYRLIGRAETHAALGFQRLDCFDPDHLRRTLRGIRAAGRPPFTAAYTVSGYASMGGSDKIENVARLFNQLHSGFDALYSRVERSVSAEEAHRVLRSAFGFGDFLAYQVLVDLLYPLRIEGGRPLLPFRHDDWARAGPGARRGISLLRGPGCGLDDLAVMHRLREWQRVDLARPGSDFPWLLNGRGRPIPLSLADIQNCLCEFHKYVKIRDGSGRGRRKFVPRPGSAIPDYSSGSGVPIGTM